MAPFPPRAQSAFWRRIAGIVALWVVATAVVLVVAAESKVGPILLRLSERHGVHAGDVVALVVAYAAAAVPTRRILRRGRRAEQE